jgi:hypothetical protein
MRQGRLRGDWGSEGTVKEDRAIRDRKILTRHEYILSDTLYLSGLVAEKL